jgi:hypothetical protein
MGTADPASTTFLNSRHWEDLISALLVFLFGACVYIRAASYVTY